MVVDDNPRPPVVSAQIGAETEVSKESLRRLLKDYWVYQFVPCVPAHQGFFHCDDGGLIQGWRLL